jgi:hypothetical protein
VGEVGFLDGRFRIDDGRLIGGILLYYFHDRQDFSLLRHHYEL